MTNNILSRVFIVGCPRSGTTLLQSLIAAHPLVFSIPETHFFPHIVSKRRIYRLAGISSRNAGDQLIKFMKLVGYDGFTDKVSKSPISVKQYTEVFTRTLDSLTISKEKRIWAEKTPRHLYYIKYIEKYISKAKFIHLLRNGSDVVASLYDVCRRYPEDWAGPRSIDQCLQRWITDTEITFSYQNKSSHLLIAYEDLIQNPKNIVAAVCDFLSLHFSDEILEKYKSATTNLILPGEKWKRSVKKPIQYFNNSKFYEVFDDKQRQYITDQLSKISRYR
jgi:hypothetical protein